MWNVGVDLGSENVKIVCLAPKKDGFHLISYGLLSRANHESVRATLQSSKLKHSNLRVSMKDSMVKIRKLVLPSAPSEDLDKMIKMEMRGHLPEPLENYILRYEPAQKLALIAEKTQIDKYLYDLQLFGIGHPAILEPRANSLVLAALHNHSLSDTRSYAIIDIGKTAALFSVISDNAFAFARNLSETSSRDALEPWLAQLVIEIQNSIENYQIQFGGPKIEELFLTGGFSKKEGLLAYLESALRIKTHHLKSFRHINTSKFQQINFESIEQYYATAIGLAL